MAGMIFICLLFYHNLHFCSNSGKSNPGFTITQLAEYHKIRLEKI